MGIESGGSGHWSLAGSRLPLLVKTQFPPIQFPSSAVCVHIYSTTPVIKWWCSRRQVKLWITLFTDYNHNAGRQRCRHNIGHTRSPIMRIQPHTNELFRWALSKQLPTARRADSFSHFPGVREEFPSLVCRGCSGGGAGGKRGVSVAREVITPSRHRADPRPTQGEQQQAALNLGKIIAETYWKMEKRPMPLPITWSHNTAHPPTSSVLYPDKRIADARLLAPTGALHN